MMRVQSDILYSGPKTIACDGQCDKAFGVVCRPRVALSPDDDDVAFLADHELTAAPRNPGTYEGGEGKPRTARDGAHNRWCSRQCERSVVAPRGTIPTLPDFSRRLLNQPHQHNDADTLASAFGTGTVDPRFARWVLSTTLAHGETPPLM